MRVMLTVLCLLAALLAPACSIEPSISFPSLETAQTTLPDSTKSSESNPNATSKQQTLTLALPVGEDALAALRLLYLAKKSGLLNQEAGQYIGQQIAMDDLRQFDGNLKLQLINVSLADGANTEQLKAWQAAANMPDIVYCQNAAASVGMAAFKDISDDLYGNKLLAATHIYASTLESVRRGNAIYGIPYLVSTPLLFLNRTLLSQYSASLPATDWSWMDWRAMIVKTQQAVQNAGLAADATTLAGMAGDPERLASYLANAVFMLDDPSELLSYLPASLSLSAGWATWDGQSFPFSGEAFASAAKWLQKALPTGSSPIHLAPDQYQMAFKGQVARQSGRIMMWTADSASIAAWHQQTAFAVTECLVPSSPAETGADTAARQRIELLLRQRIPIRVRALMVSKQSRTPDLAADLAAFLALDADSLLMQSRFGTYEGLVPVIQDDLVWQTLVAQQRYGRSLAILKAKMPQAYSSGQQIISRWEAVIQATIVKYGPQLLLTTDPATFSSLLAQIESAARLALEG